MGLVGYIEALLEEYKKEGVAAVKLKDLVAIVVRDKQVLPQSVYNAIKTLELQGKVEIKGNRRNKIVIIK